MLSTMSAERRLLQAKCQFWWPLLEPIWKPASDLRLQEALIAVKNTKLGKDIPHEVVLAAAQFGTAFRDEVAELVDKRTRRYIQFLVMFRFFDPLTADEFDGIFDYQHKSEIEEHVLILLEKEEKAGNPYKWFPPGLQDIIENTSPEEYEARSGEFGYFQPEWEELDECQGPEFYNPLFDLKEREDQLQAVSVLRQTMLDIHFEEVPLSSLEKDDSTCAICQETMAADVDQIIAFINREAMAPPEEWKKKLAESIKNGTVRKSFFSGPNSNRRHEERIERLRVQSIMNLRNSPSAAASEGAPSESIQDRVQVWANVSEENYYEYMRHKLCWEMGLFESKLLAANEQLAPLLEGEGMCCQLPTRVSCGHVFGLKCIRKWAMPPNEKVSKSKECPLCRADLCGPNAVFEKVSQEEEFYINVAAAVDVHGVTHDAGDVEEVFEFDHQEHDMYPHSDEGYYSDDDHTHNDHTDDDHMEVDHTDEDNTHNDHTDDDHTDDDYTEAGHTDADNTDDDHTEVDYTDEGHRGQDHNEEQDIPSHSHFEIDLEGSNNEAEEAQSYIGAFIDSNALITAHLYASPQYRSWDPAWIDAIFHHYPAGDQESVLSDAQYLILQLVMLGESRYGVQNSILLERLGQLIIRSAPHHVDDGPTDMPRARVMPALRMAWDLVCSELINTMMLQVNHALHIQEGGVVEGEIHRHMA